MQDFIHKIIQNKSVFTLKNKEAVAVCQSATFFIEENDQPISVYPFWSSYALAEKCLTQEWQHYEVFEIPLTDFMEYWCLGMYEDGVAVGIDFDENLYGEEEIPTDLLQKILAQLTEEGIHLTFQNFKSVKHLKNYLETEF